MGELSAKLTERALPAPSGHLSQRERLSEEGLRQESELALNDSLGTRPSEYSVKYFF